MKLKIKVTKTETKEIDVTFPIFTENSKHCKYAILSDTHAIKVSYYPISNTIEICDVSPNLALSDNKQISRRDFMKHYEIAVDRIVDDFEKMFKDMTVIEEAEDATLRDNYTSNDDPAHEEYIFNQNQAF